MYDLINLKSFFLSIYIMILNKNNEILEEHLDPYDLIYDSLKDIYIYIF
jgi:hypothetical protein